MFPMPQMIKKTLHKIQAKSTILLTAAVIERDNKTMQYLQTKREAIRE